MFDLALPILIEYKYIHLGLIKQADDRSRCWKFLEGVSGVLEGRGGKGEADAPRKPLKTCYHQKKPKICQLMLMLCPYKCIESSVL